MHLRLNTATVVKNILVLHVLQQSFLVLFPSKCQSVCLLNDLMDILCIYKDTRLLKLDSNSL